MISLSFISSICDDFFIGKCQEEVQELQLALAETTNELNKSLKLLSLQNTISQDHKREMEAMKTRMNQMTEERVNKMEEYTQLLEMRSQRIKVIISCYMKYMYMYVMVHVPHSLLCPYIPL